MKVVDAKTQRFIEETVKGYCSPDMIQVTLRHFEEQVEEAEGEKKLVLQAFVEGIKGSLGKV